VWGAVRVRFWHGAKEVLHEAEPVAGRVSCIVGWVQSATVIAATTHTQERGEGGRNGGYVLRWGAAVLDVH
jgi:hypothetical protein